MAQQCSCLACPHTLWFTFTPVSPQVEGRLSQLTSTVDKPHVPLSPTTTSTRVLHTLRVTMKFISSSQKQPAEVHMQSLSCSPLIHRSIVPRQPAHHSLAELSKSAKPAQVPVSFLPDLLPFSQPPPAKPQPAASSEVLLKKKATAKKILPSASSDKLGQLRKNGKS